MKYIPQGVTRQLGRQILTAKKHSPQIMFAAGIAGVVTSTVMACKATLELADDLDKMKGELERVKATNHTQNPDDRKAVAVVYAKNTAHVVRLYGPSALVGVASIGLLTGSHVALNRRNAGLTAAYTAVSKAYDEYRDRVKEELGPEKELDIYHAAKSDMVDIGNKKLEEVKRADPAKWSPYARFFDEQSSEWIKNAEMNQLFVKCQQEYLNHLLKTRGHVFLNEVYDQLGFDRTKDGAVVGWVIGPEGDNYIDFGLYEAHNDRFMHGWDRSPLLDFNVDGIIYDKI